MRLLRVFLMSIIVAWGVGGSAFFVVPEVNAQDACNCYCAVDNVGATPAAEVRITPESCKTVCDLFGFPVAACAYNAAQLPSQNVSCFTSTQCALQNGTFGKSQPGECMPNFRFCYPKDDKTTRTTLQVSIGELSVTGDFGEYIGVAYKWLVGSGALFAIVMIMISGLQWSLGAASSESIGKAKSRLKNAIIGLVLLMSTYLILATVNPQLLSLQVPKFPMIRTLDIGSTENSCDYLIGRWGSAPYTVANGAPSDSPFAVGQPAPTGGTRATIENLSHGALCGSVGEITLDWKGASVLSGSTCTFRHCPTADEVCVGSADFAQCLGCKDINSSNSGENGISPDEATCAIFSSSSASSTCVLTEVFDTSFDFFKSCGELTIDCGKITKCSDYGSKSSLSTSGKTGNMEFWDRNILDETSMTFQDVCEQDLCGLALKPGGSACFYEEGTVQGSCSDAQ
jgi:hypothetical protein